MCIHDHVWSAMAGFDMSKSQQLTRLYVDNNSAMHAMPCHGHWHGPVLLEQPVPWLCQLILVHRTVMKTFSACQLIFVHRTVMKTFSACQLILVHRTVMKKFSACQLILVHRTVMTTFSATSCEKEAFRPLQCERISRQSQRTGSSSQTGWTVA
jgi:hypothetical protein